MQSLKYFAALLMMSMLCSAYAESGADNAVPNASRRESRQMSFWPYSGGISRQVFDMLDIVTDVAMLTLLGIPILGLVALGATAIGPFVGSGAAGRKKRETSGGLMDRAGRAFMYARNLFDVLANLEDAFQKYEIKESECQLKAVCEAHKAGPDSEYKDFGNHLIELIRLQKDLEEYEIIPLAKLIFGQYADAATYGREKNDCAMVYSRCPHSLSYFLEKHHSAPTEQEH